MNFYEQLTDDYGVQEELVLQQAAAHELENERQYETECAIRAALTLGLPIEQVKTLCSESGIDYRRITGEI
jgi:hypothetical protein